MSAGCDSSSRLAMEYIPDTTSRRVLLINPPVYDTRFPWSQWQQPLSLLQLGTLLRSYQCDVRFVNALHTTDTSLKRQRMRLLSRDQATVNYWRFGVPERELHIQLQALKDDKWEPEEVYIECLTTFWWEGTAEATRLVRQHFPHARLIVLGTYPTLASEHALEHISADVFVCGSVRGLAGLPLDYSLYTQRPVFAYLSIGVDERSSCDVVEEFLQKADPADSRKRIRQFAFADHNVVKRFPEQFRAVLQTVIDRQLQISFYALGNIYPRDILEDPELASLLFRSHFRQIVFADDRDVPTANREQYLYECQKAIQICVAAGFHKQTENLVGTISIGRPGENIQERASFMTQLAHSVGTLIVIPYQPLPTECPHLPLEYQNGKLFPFAEQNGATYRVYQDMLGLAAILNAKYRSHTFDFLGESLVSRLVRSSLVTSSWDPQRISDRKQERPVTVGWFNKEGKWVKS